MEALIPKQIQLTIKDLEKKTNLQIDEVYYEFEDEETPLPIKLIQDKNIVFVVDLTAKEIADTGSKDENTTIAPVTNMGSDDETIPQTVKEVAGTNINKTLPNVFAINKSRLFSHIGRASTEKPRHSSNYDSVNDSEANNLDKKWNINEDNEAERKSIRERMFYSHDQPTTSCDKSLHEKNKDTSKKVLALQAKNVISNSSDYLVTDFSNMVVSAKQGSKNQRTKEKESNKESGLHQEDGISNSEYHDIGSGYRLEIDVDVVHNLSKVKTLLEYQNELNKEEERESEFGSKEQQKIGGVDNNGSDGGGSKDLHAAATKDLSTSNVEEVLLRLQDEFDLLAKR
ncbi:hypothetical protein AX774_g5069 [Zancudomyces culisetae]|uniref:Uncharacterized protein n=1 Tax=Zancudomyces culisetae TaxID=1213189 RepID=A0A1R1PKI3_ZANCU|nr:hypothetical protein AX774_g5069 [Zancudomyces culisetae]|eukprot:OMH81474.1 hypothetical protein AX774_g5069 [Zancudomyces culisetae]